MSQTQDGDQIEQDQIAQFERAYELRAGFCRLRGHKPGKRDKINYSESYRQMIDEMYLSTVVKNLETAGPLSAYSRVCE
jgi:hypothetical protein